MTQKQVSPAERERRVMVRAGIFVALGLALAGVVVFVIGKERNLFEKENTYVGAFENVDGLQLDSPVRLGGLEAGRVQKIEFAPNLDDKRIIVTLQVRKKFADRVRKDSVARVTGRGVLGDKAVDISLGSMGQPEIPSGGEITTGTSGDISSLLKATGEMIDNAVGITRDLRSGVQTYTNPQMQSDVTAMVQSARGIIEEIQTGKGVMHTLVYDKKTSDDVRSVIASAAESAQHLDGAIAKVDGILNDVKSGNGTLHALIYDAKVAQAVEELGGAADEVAKLVHDAKNSKEGAVYQLVYGDARSMLADLGHSAADLKAITTKIKKGEGSLGGIINDPTVYEDLKEILGNVKRNRVLRELVRYSISNGEAADKAGKPEEKPKGK